MRLAPYAGFDAAQARGCKGYSPRSEKTKALVASRMAHYRLRRWKDLVRTNPPTAAQGGFPYPHRTCAQIERRGLPNGRRA